MIQKAFPDYEHSLSVTSIYDTLLLCSTSYIDVKLVKFTYE